MAQARQSRSAVLQEVAEPVGPTGWALDVLREEAAVIDRIVADPPLALADAIACVADAANPVLCCGVGKSGLVAAKIAATLSSLGTPAFALSAGDAAHGDLGAVLPGSVVLLFSNSGTTAEILRIVPGLRARGCHLIGLVGRAASPLGRAVDTLIDLPVTREADHIGMAPTASTTLQMAMGDAIAVAASRLRGFTRDDFLKCHPAGQLGQHALPVASLMRTGDAMPVVMPHMALAETASVMSAGLMGAACVIDHDNRLLGIIVDGDVRRAVQSRTDLYGVAASAVMRTDPVVLSASATIGDALELMRAHGSGLLVLPVTDDSGHLVGMVHSVDLVQSL
ncbi:MAG: KpsF/GutQ family sugar-phosphate isomerase [Novosphingobium sp.]|nr:KpsF/GutQ family sugar-phosphate isomerase [Novosphingobium sp.]